MKASFILAAGASAALVPHNENSNTTAVEMTTMTVAFTRLEVVTPTGLINGLSAASTLASAPTLLSTITVTESFTTTVCPVSEASKISASLTSSYGSSLLASPSTNATSISVRPTSTRSTAFGTGIPSGTGRFPSSSSSVLSSQLGHSSRPATSASASVIGDPTTTLHSRTSIAHGITSLSTATASGSVQSSVPFNVNGTATTSWPTSFPIIPNPATSIPSHVPPAHVSSYIGSVPPANATRPAPIPSTSAAVEEGATISMSTMTSMTTVTKQPVTLTRTRTNTVPVTRTFTLTMGNTGTGLSTSLHTAITVSPTTVLETYVSTPLVTSTVAHTVPVTATRPAGSGMSSVRSTVTRTLQRTQTVTLTSRRTGSGATASTAPSGAMPNQPFPSGSNSSDPVATSNPNKNTCEPCRPATVTVAGSTVTVAASTQTIYVTVPVTVVKSSAPSSLVAPTSGPFLPTAGAPGLNHPSPISSILKSSSKTSTATDEDEVVTATTTALVSPVPTLSKPYAGALGNSTSAHVAPSTAYSSVHKPSSLY